MNPNVETLKQKLVSERSAWESRLAAIRRDRRHESVPLDPDAEEQAIQLENEETLDGLDARGQQALSAIDAALRRIDDGTYGTCVSCGETIPAARLHARPAAVTCVACRRSEDEG